MGKLSSPEVIGSFFWFSLKKKISVNVSYVAGFNRNKQFLKVKKLNYHKCTFLL